MSDKTKWAHYFESLPWVAQLPLCLGRGFLACACMIAGLNLRYFDAFAFSVKGYMIFAVYLWHMIFLIIFGLLLLKIFGIQFVLDEYFAGFIPQGRWGIMLSTAALTIWMCMLLAKIKCKNV